MSEPSNSAGRATALTILTPLKPRWSLWLRLLFFLGTVLPLPRWTLLRLRRIHYARFAILARLRGERLHSRYLFFESNFNGNWHSYIEAFSYVFPKGMRALWGSSYGFPGPVPVGPFKEWVRRNEYVAGHYFSAYPEATTRTVLSALELEQPLRELARDAEALEADAFARAYGDFLTAAQHHL